MTVNFKRNEDWFLNNIDLNNVNECSESSIRRINNAKYLRVASSDIGSVAEKLKMLKAANVNLQGKEFVIEVVSGCYLTKEQCDQLSSIKHEIQACGSSLRIKDGDFWELEEVSVVASSLDEVVTKITSATIEQDGVKRSLNELEKFIWAYSFVANRKYVANTFDLDSPRHITSIMKTGDCVCVGFATILKELCNRLNIECYINSCQVLDRTNNSYEGHCNNVVVINGEAYYCDACWDCVSEKRRPRRTFAHCLTSFQDVQTKYEIQDVTAPFVDFEGDLQKLQSGLQLIQSKETITEEEYKEFMSYRMANIIGKYIKIIPQYEYKNKTDFFLNRKYKEEAIFYYTEAIRLIESKKIKKYITLEDFETSLQNIYMCMGNSATAAEEKTKLDIDASVAEAGLSYLDSANNCFSKEYHNKLSI